jgi:hypothetical protein
MKEQDVSNFPYHLVSPIPLQKFNNTSSQLFNIMLLWRQQQEYSFNHKIIDSTQEIWV